MEKVNQNRDAVGDNDVDQKDHEVVLVDIVTTKVESVSLIKPCLSRKNIYIITATRVITKVHLENVFLHIDSVIKFVQEYTQAE